MSNIFDFPPGRRAGPSVDFLNGSVDLVRFDDLSRNSLTAEDTGGEPARPCHDWSNQELASIYHVRSLLAAAGVSTVIDRGLSDEGDPWCVFCRSDGEVFLHLCRIDGRYLLDSPNLIRPLEGATFSELIEAFAGRPDAVQDGGSEPARGQVVRLHRGDNVVLHPATMLAALVWTILLRSDEVVLLQLDPEDAATEAAALAGRDPALAPAPALEPAPGTDGQAHPDGTAPEGARHLEHERPATADAIGGPRDVTSKVSAFPVMTGVAAGLSSVAIACGFMSEGLIDAAGRLGVSLLDEPGTEPEGDAGTSEPDAEIDAIRFVEFVDALSGGTADGVNSADAPSPAASDTAAAPAAQLLLPDGIAEMPGKESVTGPVEVRIDSVAEPQLQDAVFVGLGPASLAGEPHGNSVGELSPGAGETGIDDIRQLLPAEVRPFDIGGYTVKASFDPRAVGETESVVLDAALAVVQAERSAEDPVSSSGAGRGDGVVTGDAEEAPTVVGEGIDIAGSDATATATVPSEVSGDRETASGHASRNESQDPPATVSDPRGDGTDDDLPVFDETARDFIHFLRSRTEDLEVLTWEDSIMVVDMSLAVAPVYMAWELPDGGTVSTLVTQADYEAFGLIV